MAMLLPVVALAAVLVPIVLPSLVWPGPLVDRMVEAVVVVLLLITASPLVLAVLAVLVQSISLLTANMNLIINNIFWSSEDNTVWTSSEGQKIIINPAMNEEQVINSIKAILDQPAPAQEKTDADRIAELEAQVKALIAKLS